MKTVVITGGNKGIGAQISKTFHAAGYQVFIAARSSADFIKTLSKNIYFIKTDVTQEKDHQNLIKKVLEKSKQIDIFINCAGFSEWMPIQKVTQKFLDLMIDTNLKGTLWGCKAAAAVMTRGCIINISSLAGKRGSAHNTVYSATKFAVNGMTQSLAKELGPRGIRVNAVCPVYVETDGVITALEKIDSPAKGTDVKKFLKKFANEQTALQRLPKASEIAQTCLFLASENASAITGQCINVDCGVMPQ